MKKLVIFSLSILFFFSACRKDVNDVKVDVSTPNPTIENYNPPVDNIVGNLVGFIVDENNMPVGDATVKMNNEITTTDEYGHFFFSGKTMNSLGALVQVEKDGYFEGSRRFFPKQGEQSRVKIQLLTKSYDNTFSAASGGLVNIGNASVEFSANSIQLANGDLYTSTVHVAAKWMDPSSTATLDQMPGNLQGVNAAVEQVALGTYGMVAVELKGDNDEPLNIAAGSTARLTMPVPASLLGAAPSQIPLWSYYESYGLWVEESTASLQGGNYVGDVSHFSFWNCDIPYDVIELSMTIVDSDGDPVGNSLVQLSLSNGSMTCSGYTDGSGNIAGLVPANETMTIDVLDICGNSLYNDNVGPFSGDTDLGNITVSGSSVNNTELSGNLLDCNGDPVTNGLVIASFDGQSVYHYTTTSNFTMSFSTCSSSGDVNVVGIDIDNSEQSDALTASAGTQTDLGNINVCGNQLQDYIIITINGVTKTYLGVTANLSPTGYTYIEAQGGNDYYFGFGFGGNVPGDYSDNNTFEMIFDSANSWNYVSDTDGFTSLIVTDYGTNIVGTFNGQLIDNAGGIVSASGEFNVTQ